MYIYVHVNRIAYTDVLVFEHFKIGLIQCIGVLVKLYHVHVKFKTKINVIKI